MHIIKAGVRRFLQRMGYSVSRMDDLTYLANTLDSDKGTVILDAHGYTRIYTRLFEPLRDKEITLVEIGLFRHHADRRRAVNAVEGIKAVTSLSTCCPRGARFAVAQPVQKGDPGPTIPGTRGMSV
jgi:hypothetical protein